MSLILAFPGMEALALGMAERAVGTMRTVGIHRFPDGESLVTLPPDIAGQDVAILATLHHPDELALQLRFAAATAREMGARSVGLVCPYLAYMRQDRRFVPGQAVSAPIFARFLEQSFDWLVTVDPHLHRIHSLDELFTIPTRRIEAAPLLADWLKANIPDAVLLGPDGESHQWVAQVARLADRPFEVLTKMRSGDRAVQVSVPKSVAQLGGTPVILDDIASTGRTMVRAVERLLETGTRPPVCMVIHAVFAGDAQAEILAAGAARIVTSNSIPHASNVISLAEPLAEAVSAMITAIPQQR